MDTETLLSQAEYIIQPFCGALLRKENNRVDAVVEVKNLIAVVQALVDGHWGYLAAITGLDHPAVEGQNEGVLEAVYLFANGNAIAGLRTAVPYSNPVVPTLCNIIPSATLYERELMELFGVDVEGTPVREKLVLPDDWPDGVYPLRKSFTGFGAEKA
ncbi:MAG: NADH-quinone oxidoreductase subunit C [Anaerolineae bacterium]|nr:NADH-quinone oxidoreductase subunit C [Anaerolineae bacterium]